MKIVYNYEELKNIMQLYFDKIAFDKEHSPIIESVTHDYSEIKIRTKNRNDDKDRYDDKETET